MSLEPTNIRANAVDLPAPRQPRGVMDTVLAPVDYVHDALAGGLKSLDQAAERKTEHVPLLGALVQFGTGAGSALLGMVDGTYQMVRHPINAIKGLWSMASHVPLSPMWLLNCFKDGLGPTLGADKAFWGAVVNAYVEPYKQDWRAHRYFAVAGRAAVDIGTIYLTARQAQRAVQGWRSERAIEKAGLATDGEEGLKAAILGTEPEASGQVIREGQVLIDGTTPGERMLQHARLKTKPSPALPSTVGTRRQLEKAASRFAGDRTALREQAIVQLREDRANFMRINRVGADRLRTDAVVQTRYKLLTTSVEKRMDQELMELLGKDPGGLPKDPMRAAAKLDLLQPGQGKNFRLGNLDDLTRGRINLPKLDVKEMKSILETLKEHYGRDNLVIHDYIQGKPFYRGRLHVKIRDGSGMWYELQVGPKQISQFYDTPFKLVGKEANIHDAVYKGLMQLSDDAIKAVGGGSLRAGRHTVAAVLNKYVDKVDEVVALAKQGRSFDFSSTAALREAIEKTVKQVPPALLPVGLK
ncbi:MAG: hypothetical protein JWM80_3966 [Cyanobacteria bacterium RYN_339]|nr:hypothetical protein [Cyanobacteria bacterium RYN_339]